MENIIIMLVGAGILVGTGGLLTYGILMKKIGTNKNNNQKLSDEERRILQKRQAQLCSKIKK